MEAGIDREEVYVTNAVKHFKFIERGKRRIHAKPNVIVIRACHPWLEAEIEVFKPELIVCLGETAAQSLLGRQFRLTRQRGVFLEHDHAKYVMATVHPSALLRAPDPERRQEEYRLFIKWKGNEKRFIFSGRVKVSKEAFCLDFKCMRP